MNGRRGGGRRAPAPKRFRAKYEISPSGCWLWIGCINSKGYGCFGFGGSGKTVLAHRWSYEQFVGPIPAGMQLDHRCRDRRCVNPDHLEAVTNRENTIRGIEARKAAQTPLLQALQRVA